VKRWIAAPSSSGRRTPWPAAVHERMPVILPRAQYRHWLDPACRDRQGLLQLLAPCPEDWIVRRRVGPGVNSVQNAGREPIKAVTEANNA